MLLELNQKLTAAVEASIEMSDKVLPVLRWYNELLKVIKQVHAQHADDLCWMDIDLIFKAAGLPVPDRSVGDPKAMLKNCDRYVNGMCKGGTWKSYAQLEKELELKNVEIQELEKSHDGLLKLLYFSANSMEPIECGDLIVRRDVGQIGYDKRIGRLIRREQVDTFIVKYHVELHNYELDTWINPTLSKVVEAPEDWNEWVDSARKRHNV